MTSFATKTIATTLAALVAVSSFAVVPSYAAPRGYCDAYARRVANRRANGGNVLAGAALGAGAGAILGAALGNGHGSAVATGAILGGAGGAVVSGAATSDRWRRIYNQAFWDCRRNM